MKLTVTMSINGRAQTQEIEPRLLLVHFLRDVAGLTGTKIGCDTSQCGACTVLLDGVAVKSCTCLAVQADGASVTTIEGLASDGELDGAAGRVLGEARPAVRLLHARHGVRRARAPARQSESDARADPARPRRQHVPLHRLPEHRARVEALQPTRARRSRSEVGDERRRRRRRRASSARASGGAKIRGCSPAPRATPTTSRCPAWCTPRSCAARTGTRASGDRHDAARRRRPASSPSSPARTPQGAAADSVRVAAAEQRTEDRRLPRARDRRRPLRRRRRRRRRRRVARIRRTTRSI